RARFQCSDAGAGAQAWVQRERFERRVVDEAFIARTPAHSAHHGGLSLRARIPVTRLISSPAHQRGDRLLGALEQPLLGSHLVTPRRGFAHHGIFVGGGNVVHYKSVVRRLRRLPVEEVSLATSPVELRSGYEPMVSLASI